MAETPGTGNGGPSSPAAGPSDYDAAQVSGQRAELPTSPRRQAAWLKRLVDVGDLNARWQRWTIDELFEGRARVLVSLARQPLESTAAEARDLAGDQARAGARLRQAVVRAETTSPADLWGPEVVTYVNTRTLERFLRRRTEIPALPDARDLREGDVFWIVQFAEGPVLSPSALLRGAQRDVEAWDVTAAARQAAKVTYDEAVRASEGTISRG